MSGEAATVISCQLGKCGLSLRTVGKAEKGSHLMECDQSWRPQEEPGKKKWKEREWFAQSWGTLETLGWLKVAQSLLLEFRQ